MSNKTKEYRYYEVRYNEERDAFETWLAVTEGHEPTKDDYGMELSSKCLNSALDDPETEPGFISYKFLKAIARASHLGYKIFWRI